MHHTILINRATSGSGSACVERSTSEGMQLLPSGRRTERLPERADSFGRVSIHGAPPDTNTAKALPACQWSGPFLVHRQRD
jgi:NADP-dependent 3-hydroxy acid dehydrogenase YdfG